jgi:hypothetical protein
MSDDFLRILVYSSAISVAVPLLSFLRLQRRTFSFKVLLFYLLSGLCAELAGYYFVIIRGQNNIAIDHYFRLLEAMLLSLMYWSLFGWKWSKFILYLLGLLTIRIVLSHVFANGELSQINNNQAGAYHENLSKTIFEQLLKVLLVIFAIYYYYLLFENAEVENILSQGTFWVSSAVLFYFGVEMFFDTFKELMRGSSGIARALFPVHLICNMLFHGMLTVGIWMRSPK